jgi:protein-ribulosamine 3-kinase
VTDLTGATDALAGLGIRLDPCSARPVAGGCIHSAWRMAGPDGPVFLKTSPAASAWMLEAEADGLLALRDASCLRVPDVLGHGVAGGLAWLALEWLELGPVSAASERALGEALAHQHLAAGARFGWRRDNALGATPQPNGEADDWGEFFAARRIGHQLELAARQGLPARLLERGEQLRARVPELLAGHRPAPALLHGDLWSGNRAADARGGPVVFDPAVHYGDPECDLAMTRLFGGFSREFYAAYDAVIAPAPGRDRRERLYQLYHVLNHANLFGGGYVSQAERLVEKLGSEPIFS